MPVRKLLQNVFFVLTAVNGLFFVVTVIDLLKPYTGDLAYVLWIVAAPFLSPAVVALPWFEAWVNGSALNYGILLVWTLWIGIVVAMALMGSDPSRIARHPQSGEREKR